MPRVVVASVFFLALTAGCGVTPSRRLRSGVSGTTDADFARCRAESAAVELAAAPAPVERWEHYSIPSWWDEARRQAALSSVLLAVRRPLLRDGWIAGVVVDASGATFDVLANQTGHEDVIRALGGCVLYPEPACETCVIVVVPLSSASATDVARALGPSIAPERWTADVATNSVVIAAPRARAREHATRARTLDCVASARGPDMLSW